MPVTAKSMPAEHEHTTISFISGTSDLSGLTFIFSRIVRLAGIGYILGTIQELKTISGVPSFLMNRLDGISDGCSFK